MGRELKRVALDFSWPIDQLWKGYVNPFYSQKCVACDGTGYNPATNKINDDWYSFDKSDYISLSNGRRYNNAAWQYHLTGVEIEALVRAGRLNDLMPVRCSFDIETQKWLGWIDNERKEIPMPDMPSPEIVNEWAKQGLGHDSINRWICVRTRAEHLGVYGVCEHCKGEGEIWQTEEIKKLHDEWEEFDPPTGEGFQLWSTTTEGHPMTPVFKSLEALCEYCESKNVSVFGSNTATKEKWMQMLRDDNVIHQEGNMIFI